MEKNKISWHGQCPLESKKCDCEIWKRSQDTGSLPNSGSHPLSEPHFPICKVTSLDQLVPNSLPALHLGLLSLPWNDGDNLGHTKVLS